MVGVEDYQIEVIAGRLQKHEVFSTVVVEVAGNNVIEVAVFNRALVTVQFDQFPHLAGQWKVRYRIQAQKCDGRHIRAAEDDWLQAIEIGYRQRQIAHHLPRACMVAFA